MFKETYFLCLVLLMIDEFITPLFADVNQNFKIMVIGSILMWETYVFWNLDCNCHVDSYQGTSPSIFSSGHSEKHK
jgi:hypothetical protein